MIYLYFENFIKHILIRGTMGIKESPKEEG